MASRKATSMPRVNVSKQGKKKARKAKPLTDYALAQQSSDFLSRNFVRFVGKYPGEYVYALGNRVIAHGDHLENVSAEALRKAGDRASGLVLQSIPETVEDACMIL